MDRLTSYRYGPLRFEVRDEGPVDGTPVVLLHGFPQDGTCWDQVVAPLHAAGLRTLVPDQRGYSPGARPLSRADYRIDALVDDVVELLEVAGLSHAHLVGHDWGGFVGWAAAYRYPLRFPSLTVLSTPHPRAMWRSLFCSDQALRSLYVAFFQLPVLPEALIGDRLEDMLVRQGLPASYAAQNAQRMREPHALRAALNWYRAIPLAGLDAGRIQVPTTYIWGNEDPALGRKAAELTAEHVRAAYRFVELDANHWLPETRPADIASLVIERVTGAEPNL